MNISDTADLVLHRRLPCCRHPENLQEDEGKGDIKGKHARGTAPPARASGPRASSSTAAAPTAAAPLWTPRRRPISSACPKYADRVRDLLVNTDFPQRSRVNEMVHNFIDPGLRTSASPARASSGASLLTSTLGMSCTSGTDALFNYTTALGFMNEGHPDSDYDLLAC